MGPIISAGLVAGIGDVSRFNNEATLAKYSSLVWNKYQSGNFCDEETSLAKCGNQHPRYSLVEVANFVRMHSNEFADYYAKKYAEVTKHQHKRALVRTPVSHFCIASQQKSYLNLCQLFFIISYSKYK